MTGRPSGPRAGERLARARRRPARPRSAPRPWPRARSRGASAGCSTWSRRACCRRGRDAASISSTRLSPRIETQRTWSRAGSLARSQSTASGVCAPSQTSSPRRSSRPGSSTSTSASTGRSRNAAAASRGATDARARASGGMSSLERVVRRDNYSCRMRNCQLLLRDLLRRVAEHLGVLERDVREQHDRRVDDVRRVEPPAEARLDDGHVHSVLGELGQRGGCQHLELGRSERFRGTANARDGPLERSPDHNPAARASPRRAATCRRPPAGPRPAATRRSSGSRSTCRSSRPRGSKGRPVADRRAPRAAPACGRARTPPATGSSEATHSVAVDGLVAEGIELTTVARELLALRLDNLGRRLRREPLVREHALGAGDLLLEPVDLGLERRPLPARAWRRRCAARPRRARS